MLGNTSSSLAPPRSPQSLHFYSSSFSSPTFSPKSSSILQNSDPFLSVPAAASSSSDPKLRSFPVFNRLRVSGAVPLSTVPADSSSDRAAAALGIWSFFVVGVEKGRLGLWCRCHERGCCGCGGVGGGGRLRLLGSGAGREGEGIRAAMGRPCWFRNRRGNGTVF